MFKIQIVLLSALVLVFVSGCSSKVPAHGTVKFSDGEPLQSGTVYLSNGVHMFQGMIRPDGTFKLGGIRPGDGMPPGKYRAWLANVNGFDYLIDETGQKTAQRVEKIVVDPKYVSAEHSGLKFDVDKQSPTVDIVVERPKS